MRENVIPSNAIPIPRKETSRKEEALKPNRERLRPADCSCRLPLVSKHAQQERRFGHHMSDGYSEISPLAECILFWLAFGKTEYLSKDMWRDFIAILVANLASFGVGEVFNAWSWFGLLG